jgi:hypothetical protein
MFSEPHTAQHNGLRGGAVLVAGRGRTFTCQAAGSYSAARRRPASVRQRTGSALRSGRLPPPVLVTGGILLSTVALSVVPVGQAFFVAGAVPASTRDLVCPTTSPA